MFNETEPILGLEFNKVRKVKKADIVFQAKSKRKHKSTLRTKYGMEISFYQAKKKLTHFEMQDIHQLTGYALGLEDLKGDFYDNYESAMAANYSDNHLGWSSNDINALQSLW